MNLEYMLGANYWSERWGTEMWRHYDGKEIDSSETELYTFNGCTDIKIK